jgi:hypothetical protein
MVTPIKHEKMREKKTRTKNLIAFYGENGKIKVKES